MATSLDYQGLSYQQLLWSLIAKACSAGLKAEFYGVLRYPEGEFPLLKLSSMEHERLVVVSANIHGDEVAGALTFEHLGDVFSYADARKVSLIAYPCTNPTGFDRRIRYNIRNEMGNNDFLRYILPDGSAVDDIGEGRDFVEWKWSSDASLGQKLPLETQLLHEELKRLPFGCIKGAADLHQDCFLDFCATHYGSYAYVLDKKEELAPIARQAEGIVPLLRNTQITSGYGTVVDENGQVIANSSIGPWTDGHGFVKRHDGSLQDLFHRLGVPYTVTVETTGNVPLEKSVAVNLAWVRGIIDLAARA